jgi:ribosome-binding factor A
MTPYSRSDRVGSQIQKILSELLSSEINDPRLKNVVITSVKMTRDLRIAKVYFLATDCQKNKKKKKETTEGFKSAFGFIKRTLAEKLGLRYMPDLRFYYDDSFDYGSRIDSLLNDLKKDYA